MAKKIIQDIYVGKKSIRSIQRDNPPVRTLRKTELPKKETIESESVEEVFIERAENQNEKVSKNSHFFLWLLCIVCFGFVLFLLSSVFGNAVVTITPKTQAVVFNDSYNITTDTSNTKDLHYQIMTVTKTLSKDLATDGQASVETKAIGKAIIYNNNSSSKQRIVNNTRLQSVDGLIYRTRASVDVPGIKTVNGVKTPGSAEVEIIADMPGDKYNMKVSDLKGDFKIPGFEGSPKYTTFYARLSADATGGFIGNVGKVSPDAITAGRVELLANLKTNLVKDIYSQTPDQFIVFKDNYFIQTNDLPDLPKDNSYQISEQAVAYAVMFKKDELSNYLAKSKIKNFDNSQVNVLWSDDIVATTTGATNKPWTEKSLKLSLTGKSSFVWVYDPAVILSAIKGQSKDILNVVLQNNPSIKEIQASIRPQWNTAFPKDENKIKILDSINNATN